MLTLCARLRDAARQVCAAECFTCFTGTKVQMLTLRARLRDASRLGRAAECYYAQFTQFTGTKSTSADAARAA
jgi:hypothetical protein